jgi:hypothetical protein
MHQEGDSRVLKKNGVDIYLYAGFFALFSYQLTTHIQ